MIRKNNIRKNKPFVKLFCSLALGGVLGGLAPLGVSAHYSSLDAAEASAGYAFAASSVGRSVAGSPVKNTLSVAAVSTLQTSAYSAIPVTRSGSSLGFSALLINGKHYVPVRAFATAVASARVSYSKSTRTLTVSANGLSLTATDGSYVVHANGRALFAMSPARILSDGRMYLPAETLAKAFGLSLGASGTALDFGGTVKPLASAESYYGADELLWLSRIISAESRGEPLLGQIAVGNVILNRVRSSDFPSTIWGVIFDRRYGVQFSPVANGTVYEDPTYTATLAAKICLEGFTLSSDVVYFLAPQYASSSWIVQNRTYAFTVSKHEFYA